MRLEPGLICRYLTHPEWCLAILRRAPFCGVCTSNHHSSLVRIRGLQTALPANRYKSSNASSRASRKGQRNQIRGYQTMKRTMVCRLAVWAGLAALVNTTASANLPPEMSNVRANQRTDGTKRADMRQELANADGDTRGVSGVAAPPPNIIWNPDVLSPERTTRSLHFTVAPAVPATVAAGHSALKVTMVSLQHPNPRNRPESPLSIPPNFSAFDTDYNGVCSGATPEVQSAGAPNYNGHPCNTDSDCLGPNNAISTDDGVCSNLLACTAAGETNGCARWVGKPGTFFENQDNYGLGRYHAARLQCTPYYHDWVTETANAPITVVGAEILPSSTYHVQAYGALCEGSESSCTNVSAAVTMLTRRFGDATLYYNPPSSVDQPDAIDILKLVNKFQNKNYPDVPPKYQSLIQPNLPDPNVDVSFLDIADVIQGVKLRAYPYPGPCRCPSVATCASIACWDDGSCISAYGVGAKCVKTCSNGPQTGDPCLESKHCGNTCVDGPNAGLPCNNNDLALPVGIPVGSSSCGSFSDGHFCRIVGTCPPDGGGFCRDSCGRCTP